VTQAPVGWAVIPGEVHATGAVLDHHQDVEAAEEDGVDVGEVDREDRVSLCGEELSPSRSGAQGSGVDAGVPQDLPDGGGSGGGLLVAPRRVQLPRWPSVTPL
jgi:hypothetical protein